MNKAETFYNDTHTHTHTHKYTHHYIRIIHKNYICVMSIFLKQTTPYIED